jgi:hypothetical protein
MPAPAIILNPPYILVTENAGDNSPLGVVRQTRSGSEFVFGTVAKIYSTCDSAAVGDIVFFNKIATNTQGVYYGSTQYYLVDVAFVVFKETPAP